MRLIDANELADYITENEDDFLYALKHKDRNVLDGMIERIPTAYDIDNVIEKLEEAKHTCCLYGEDAEIREEALDDAIEIVKAGGKDDRD